MNDSLTINNFFSLFRRHLVCVFAFVLGTVPICLAQGSSTTNWRDTPVPLHAHPDAATVADRKARDNYFAKLFPPPSGGLHSILGGTATVAGAPEILQIPGSIWVIGTFINYDVYEIQTGGIYTEIHFRVDRIIGSTETGAPISGKIIDIDVGGGTVLTDAGTIEHKTGWKDLYDDAPIPSHRYLMQLVLVAQGNFYDPVDYWDITTGVVTPVRSKDVMRARNGKSHLAGMNETDAVSYILSRMKR